MKDTATDEWYRRMADLEEGCDVTAGGMTLEQLEADANAIRERNNTPGREI